MRNRRRGGAMVRAEKKMQLWLNSEFQPRKRSV